MVAAEKEFTTSAPAGESPASSNRPSLRKTVRSLQVLTWIAIGHVLYAGQSAFAPMLFSLLLALLLSPYVDLLEKRRIPRVVASLLTVAVLIVAIGVLVDVAWTPTVRWVDAAPAVLQKVERKVRPLQRTVARIESLTARASTLTNASSPAKAPEITSQPPSLNAIDAGRAILIDTATIAMLTFFLLMAGGRTLRNIENCLPERGGGQSWLRLLKSVRAELSRYYLLLALINVCLGMVVTGVTALWELPNPWLWGILAGILNFIPYMGPAITIAIVSTVALVSVEGYGTALGVAGSLLAITTIEGQIVQPLLIGFRLNLNPVILFIAIWLAGWFWGVAGIFLATPLLIIFKETGTLRQKKSWLLAMLTGSSRSVPSPPYEGETL
ncbi:MAG: AI-2E family transporter [Steroidobacteraceae bacterium]